MTEVVIVLPGIMGSELWDGDERVWPGTFGELGENHDMAQLLKPDLRVGDILRRVLGFKAYKALIDALEDWGFSERGRPPTLYTCPYDWRKDAALAADTLAALIERIVNAHGRAVEIDLLGHSMGGLISRYYLESGRYRGRAGHDRVKRLVTLATPHYGTPVALLGALGLHRTFFLSEAQVRRLANDENFPALYQVMPPATHPFVWDDDPAARLAPVATFEPAERRALGLSEANMDAAAAFHGGLDLTRRPPGVEYFFVCGVDHDTICEVRVRRQDGALTVTEYERDDDAGDGTVPAWSAAHPEIRTVAAGAHEHNMIYKDREVQRVLAAVLGRAGAFRLEARPHALDAYPRTRLGLREAVVAAGTPSSAIVVFDTPIAALEAEVTLTQVVDRAAKRLAAPMVAARLPLVYRGPAIDRLAIRLSAPAEPGLYRVALVPEGTGVALAADEWVVQAAATATSP